MSSRGHPAAPARAAALVAFLALLIQALIPPGYMLAAGRTGPAAMVICTGHGPLRIGDHHDRQTPPSKAKAAGLCAFAGHGAAPVLASAARPTPIRWSAETQVGPSVQPRVFVGRGLAAPPPARGPPSPLA